MESIEPANAARTIPRELTIIPFSRRKIMVSATTSLAPEEIPSTKGPAIGLLKKVCSKNPETESAPPRMITASILGQTDFPDELIHLPGMPAMFSGSSRKSQRHFHTSGIYIPYK